MSDLITKAKGIGFMKKKQAMNLSPEEFIRFLSHRKGWHGNMYRSTCSQWIDARRKEAAGKDQP